MLVLADNFKIRKVLYVISVQHCCIARIVIARSEEPCCMDQKTY
ncbi:hypothetical protein [Rickettsia asembonensis]|nr:hypothetical protein [Rickettsia asembonensis]